MTITDILVQIYNRILPIIILLFIGKRLNQGAFLSPETIAEIKKLVVNLALPAVLFTSFLTMTIEPAYFWFVPLLLIIEGGMFLIGTFLHQRLSIQGEYFPFLITGFEYGMIGVSLFAAAYGFGQLGKIAIIDFGQELFVWFIYIALLARKREGSTNLKSLLKMFATSPVILAILSGITLNLSGIAQILVSAPLFEGVLNAITLVGSLTVPLILIVVGYGIQIDRTEIQYPLRAILIRLGILIPAALIINRTIIRGWLGLDSGFEAAFFTLMILPPPFILTLFMDQKLTDERRRIDNTLMLHTIASIAVFIVYYAFHPTI